MLVKIKIYSRRENNSWRKQVGKVKRVLQAKDRTGRLRGEKGAGLFEAGAWDGCWVMRSGGVEL